MGGPGVRTWPMRIIRTWYYSTVPMVPMSCTYDVLCTLLMDTGTANCTGKLNVGYEYVRLFPGAKHAKSNRIADCAG
jgi:hypothetical protein